MSDDTTPAPQTELTAKEASRSINGWDLIAIRQQFGKTWNELDAHETGLGLVFLDKRRKGATDADAFKAAMSTTLGEVDDYFTPEPTDVNPEEPDSPAGKGSSAAG